MDARKVVYVENPSQVKVQDVLPLLIQGSANRKVAAKRELNLFNLKLWIRCWVWANPIAMNVKQMCEDVRKGVYLLINLVLPDNKSRNKASFSFCWHWISGIGCTFYTAITVYVLLFLWFTTKSLCHRRENCNLATRC